MKVNATKSKGKTHNKNGSLGGDDIVLAVKHWKWWQGSVTPVYIMCSGIHGY